MYLEVDIRGHVLLLTADLSEPSAEKQADDI